MQLTNEFDTIRQWSFDKGILTKGTNEKQTIKLMEEVGELAAGIIRKDLISIKDAIGDIVVVLTSLSTLSGLRIEDCINESYKVIKDRTGKNVDGNFIKDDIGDGAWQLILEGMKATGNPWKAYYFAEEQLTVQEREKILPFMEWCQNNSKTFGSDNYLALYGLYEKQR